MLPLVKDNNGITVYVNGQCVSIPNDHPKIVEIKKAINEDDGDTVLNLYNVQDTINERLKEYTEEVELIGGVVYYKGEGMHNELTRRIVDLYNDGLGVQSYLNFLRKLMENPSYNSREQLFKFIGEHKLPIHEDGDILAYKGVTNDYKDLHTRSFDNSVGAKQRMDRSLVDDNPSHDCSRGFHAGSEVYARGFGDKTVIVKINPADCVSVPDYDTNKLRCCAYEVIAEYQGTMHKPFYEDLDDYDEDEWENDDDDDDDLFVDVNSLMLGDEISFSYEDKDRFGIVTNIDYDHITCRLTPLDPSYVHGKEYRQFKKEEMSEIEYV